MTREQMIAWLTLEGWEPFSGKDHNGFLHKTRGWYAWIRSESADYAKGRHEIWVGATEDWTRACILKHQGKYSHVLTDTEVEMLYRLVVGADA